MQADKTKFYMLGPDRIYEQWVWGLDDYYARYVGPEARWFSIESCGPDCCDETWSINDKSEEEFQEYLDSLPEDEVSCI